MKAHITRNGELKVVTGEQTEGYALKKWMENNQQIAGARIELIDGESTRLVIPSCLAPTTNKVEETGGG